MWNSNHPRKRVILSGAKNLRAIPFLLILVISSTIALVSVPFLPSIYSPLPCLGIFIILPAISALVATGLRSKYNPTNYRRYYQPPPRRPYQPYAQGYQAPSQPTIQANPYEQYEEPQSQYPQEMPPIQ